ncbi:Fructose-bisphosphate aldolase [Acidimicrobium ferrooxidans DSM 10331]|uniref:fructose-bisphosphate aldolase n=1 Tax=Acidimicrobium ferrooxidans (strain DSM 10331 / JCM 15462 / NBRC 103882 / ICP) TaxID=525909 RepID=C7LYN2_ACIFD|nr:class I fructose-bisphosphate aldolase [Acidimicrobium ferrooxidans]ACU53840.1 Fructose-bisphosphate aldolase [Acidimicrobium ferrooxidans DSM 10331]
MDYESLLGEEAKQLLTYVATGIPASSLIHPGPRVVDEVFASSDRTNRVLVELARLYGTGRLAGTGYVSILPVDQGVEHSAAASFAPNPTYFDPQRIVELAIEGGCSAVTTTLGALGIVSRRYAHRIPFILKLNHNELLTYPSRYDQVMFANVRQAWDMGAAGVGATVYFGSPESTRQIQEVSAAFHEAHELGMFTVLWCYLRNPAFSTPDGDLHTAADLTAQANHLGVTIEADLVKQKLPTTNGGFVKLGFGRTDPRVYERYATDHPIELTRWQVVNSYAGRIGLINSGGESHGASDLAEAVRTAIINKRAGGVGLISGRKAFQRPFEEGVALLHAIQDVYLDPAVELA